MVILALCVLINVSKSETKKKVLQCCDRTERMPSDEEGMQVPLTALMHFKEGRSFTVSSPQREQNEMPIQETLRIRTWQEKAVTEQVFCVF